MADKAFQQPHRGVLDEALFFSVIQGGIAHRGHCRPA